MKLRSILYLSVISIILSSCGIGMMSTKYNTTKFTVTPPNLQVHGNKIKISVDGFFPEKYFAKKAIVEFTPVLVHKSGEEKFKTITVQGENANGGEATIFFEPGGSFSYVDEIPYNDNIKESVLELRAKATLNDKSLNFETIKIAKGTNITSTRVIDNEVAAIADHEYETETILEESAIVYFLVNQSNIRSTEKTDTDIQKLKDFINSGNEIHSIEIKSFASPEGAVNANDDVSDRRLKSTENYTKWLLNKLDVEPELYTIKSIGEDWQGFNMLMRSSEIKDKRRITKIVNSVEDLEKREQAIRDMAELYEAIEKDILPQLRKAEITIKSFEPKKSTETIKRMSNMSPDSLEINELLYSATLAESDADKIKIYESVKSLHNDWRAYNNTACIYIDKKEHEKAKNELENSTAKENEINQNLAIIFARKGDFKKADQFYALSNPYEKNIALLNLRKGQYNKAARFFKGKKSHNAALAQILSGNNNASCNEKTAECYYLNSIIAARNSNEFVLLNNLEKAINLNNYFKAEAKSDIEFSNYSQNPSFIELLK
ncbi:MAG: hypothetical protein CMP71_06095 [Flavobacteriales bacterium]|nr:hypothetical protein [Flavobacteriales bacterium]|tara:strand:- start:32656 stop:34299 length:1644 start_codon:yes stop_codon:yes gene_type:complete